VIQEVLFLKNVKKKEYPHNIYGGKNISNEKYSSIILGLNKSNSE